MKIKKFYFSKGGHTSHTHTLELKKGHFHYSTFPLDQNGGVFIDCGPPKINTSGYQDPLESVITFLDPSDGIVEINPIKLEAFLRYVKRYCRHWENEYFAPILDGTQ